MSTFQYQKQLPKLPIPELSQTCKNYLEVLKPLQTEDEYNRTVGAVELFLKTTGPKLDEQLRNYANTRDSYIEQFWFDSYLNYDSPVVLNLNPFILLEDDPTPLQSTQISRAASLTTSSLRFIRALRRNELPVDKLKNGTPLDMDQYPKLFGSARIPSSTGCILQTDAQSHHIVILSKSQFYWFDVLDNNNDLILTENDIKLNYQTILDDSESKNNIEVAKSSFGVLTTENRRVWANLRNIIQEDEINNEILKIIDNALFIVCLDDVITEDLKHLAKNYLCGTSFLEDGIQVGTCTNRWYDKLQIIVTKNAKAGINFEHTGVDGHTVLRFASDIYTDSILRFAKTINQNSPSLWASVSPDPTQRDPKSFGIVATTPRKLEWNLTNELSLSLRFAETRLSDLIHQNEFAAIEFTNFGMERIKKMGFSPDAFVQMGFQASYYALYGKVECTYEPAMTKQFLHGRTEAIRTVSLESIDFVTNFFKDISPSEKIKYLKTACQAHSARTRQCSKGLGQDRHLYALFCIWERYFSGDLSSSNNSSTENIDLKSDTTFVDSNGDNLKKELKELPSIFADSGWDKLNNTILSTSNCGNPSLKLFGFGPVSQNGFGIGYIIKDDSISICASSKHRQTKRFLDTLNTYLLEIEQIYVASLIKEVEPKPAMNTTATTSTTDGHIQNISKDLSNYRLDNRFVEVPNPFYTTNASNNTGLSNVLKKEGSLSKLFGGYEIGNYEVGNNSDLIKSRGASPEPISNGSRVSQKLRLSEY
ncbi:hypothetical protein PACTADRAFT_48412 [Pachysolen tannophilus NRRL Y-2460]|uniref:Choline/carnitine acyltransferase domain-containing protein n=1 Tax=Pachysolen tannophilus NRRL Y-2460 TaxID=669874 RepID=A0A1E4TXV9_PACTA|nr:hypothetical protein PACTADRAFT_48412 [Pachysolen tannophilus NRRL Y-2460]